MGKAAYPLKKIFCDRLTISSWLKAFTNLDAWSEQIENNL